jgi:predicted dithiol-disulfide oxidoreductase (DUF899 family)
MHVQDISRADEWVVARHALVEELTRLRSQLYADPCALPWLHDAPDDPFEAGDDMPLALLFGAPEDSTAGWGNLFDRLDGYLRTLN